MTKPFKPTLRSIAATLGVSPITVSRVLSGHPSVSLATRTMVLEEVKKVGYNFVNNSRNLRNERGRNVIIHCGEAKFLNDKEFGFFPDLYCRCLKRLHAEEFCAHLVDFDMQPEAAFESLSQASNLIVLGPLSEDKFAQIKKNPQVSIVSYGVELPGVTQVGSSDFMGGALAAEELFRAGHRRAAVITPLNEINPRKRCGGFFTTFQMLGGEVDILRYDETGNQAADDLARERVLETYLEHGANQTTAFFCTLGYNAFFLMQYFNRKNIQVPADFSVVAYDDFEIFGMMKMARIVFSSKDIARQLVEEIKKCRNSSSALPAEVDIPPSFVMSDSLGKPSK